MISEQLKIYPSGFLGSASVLQTELPDPVREAKRIFDNSPSSEASKYTASQEVVRLWSLFAAQDNIAKTFEFKEDIIQIALKLFGDSTLIEWITIQQSAAHFSDNQARWIDETLAYVLGNRMRMINNLAWVTILKIGNGVPASKVQSETIRKYLFDNRLINPRSTITVRDFIIHWCQMPNGIYDMLAHLNVLYGAR